MLSEVREAGSELHVAAGSTACDRRPPDPGWPE